MQTLQPWRTRGVSQGHCCPAPSIASHLLKRLEHTKGASLLSATNLSPSLSQGSASPSLSQSWALLCPFPAIPHVLSSHTHTRSRQLCQGSTSLSPLAHLAADGCWMGPNTARTPASIPGTDTQCPLLVPEARWSFPGKTGYDEKVEQEF